MGKNNDTLGMDQDNENELGMDQEVENDLNGSEANMSDEVSEKESVENKVRRTRGRKSSTGSDTASEPSLGDLVDSNRLALTEKARKMKQFLSTQELLPIMINLNPGDHKDSFMEFSLNSYSFRVPKGRYIKVPKQVADMIIESAGADQRIMQGHPLNLDNRSQDAKRALNA